MAHFLETGDAPVVNTRLELRGAAPRRARVPDRDHHHLADAVGRGYFFGAFLRDISDRREQEAQLHAAKESAEAATRAKSEFLANMSHELRTPLNGVIGYAQLLQRDRTLNPTQREALEAIAKCGVHLLDLINDVLDLSKIEAGRVDIEARADRSRAAHHRSQVRGRRRGAPQGAAPDDDAGARRAAARGARRPAPAAGAAEPARQRHQVHRPGRGAAVDRGDGDDTLCFEVSDTGIGIEPEGLERIFEAFTQTREGAAAGGTGLGLTISQHLIATMGDELKVESTLGHGSRFYFALPLVPAPMPARRTWPTVDAGDEPPLDARLAPGEDLTALVVDDSTVNRRILARLLESAGVRVITAAGGPEALRLTREHRPDVDLHGPPHVRPQRARRDAPAEADPLTAGIPVIAVTASAFGESREAARDAGCVDYLSKPVRAESLFAGAARAPRRGSSSPPARPRRRPTRSCRATRCRVRLGLAPAGGGGHRQRHRPRGAGAGTGGRGCRRGGARPAHRADDRRSSTSMA